MINATIGAFYVKKCKKTKEYNFIKKFQCILVYIINVVRKPMRVNNKTQYKPSFGLKYIGMSNELKKTANLLGRNSLDNDIKLFCEYAEKKGVTGTFRITDIVSTFNPLYPPKSVKIIEMDKVKEVAFILGLKGFPNPEHKAKRLIAFTHVSHYSIDPKENKLLRNELLNRKECKLFYSLTDLKENGKSGQSAVMKNAIKLPYNSDITKTLRAHFNKLLGHDPRTIGEL